MQRWEYLEMRVDAEWNYWVDSTGTNGHLEAWELAGMRAKLDFRWFTSASRMNELGMEGWELVAALPSDQYATACSMLFKRPKP